MRSRRFLGPLLAALMMLGAGSARALDAELYAELLDRHTREVADLALVRVDYRALRESEDWRRPVRSLAESSPASLRGRNEKLAFWINAYNVLAIDLVVRHYPVESIRDIGWLLRPVWKRPAGQVGGRSYSLDEIEHGIVRPLGDPRAHAGVVCASLSCPPLLREPWRPDRLDAQLDAALRGWLADPRKGLRIDRERGVVTLSRIFDWFEEDFEDAGGVMAFVAPYLSDVDRDWLRGEGADASIEYLDYDWGLNELME